MNSVSSVVVLKRVKIPEALIMLRSDGIVHVHYKKNTTLDLDLQASMRDLFLELTGGKKVRSCSLPMKDFHSQKKQEKTLIHLKKSSD